MGVYIKDMEMPTRCGRCDMCIKEADGDIDYHYECCITAARIGNLGEKMEDCPLVPVPAHGRLIDADALAKMCQEMQSIEWNSKAAPYSWAYAYESFEGDIDNAPTVIDAEDGET